MKNIYLLLITMMFFFYSQMTFSENNIPTFYFDQYQPTSNCLFSSSGCNIKIEKPIYDINGKFTGYESILFNSKPLIFLMPTIEQGQGYYEGLDAPSTLRISKIQCDNSGKCSFNIKQVFAPINNTYLRLENLIRYDFYNFIYFLKKHHKKKEKKKDEILTLYKIPMQKISYFAMEKGTINLGRSGRITAGSIYTNKYITADVDLYSKNDDEIKNPNWTIINKYEDNGYLHEIENEGFSDDSGLILNEQEYNTTNWVTPVAIKDEEDFYIGLDSSEVHKGNGKGKGTLHNNIQLAYLQVEGRGVFKGLNFILGSGDTANTLQKNLKYPETITGPVIEECNAYMDVPNTAFNFQKNVLVVASKNSRKGPNGGWLRLCKQKHNNNTLQVSFVNDEDLNEKAQKSLERGHHDEEVGFMAFQRQLSESVCDLFPGPVQTWDGNSTGYLQVDSKIIIKGVPLIDGHRRVGFPIVNYYGNPTYTECSGSKCFSDGFFAKKEILGNIPDNNDGYLQYQSDIDKVSGRKIFYFLTINLNNEHVIVPNGSIIHTWNMSLVSSSIRAKSGNPDDLIIYIHNKQGIGHSYSEVNNGSSITGLIYSEREIDISNGKVSGCDNYETCQEVSRINGAITAKAIKAHGNSKIIGVAITGQSACFESEPNYSLTITPKIKTNTLCDDQPITFNVQASDGSSSNYTGQIHVTISSRFGGQWANNASFSDAESFDNTASFQLNVKNNQAKFWLRANDAEKITVSGTIDKMEGAAPIGVYSFIPGGFKITPQSANIIAGKPFSATITAVACPAKGKEKPISMYDGEKTLNFSTQYQSPKMGNVAVNILRDNSQLTTSATIRFNKGESEPLTLQYSDAGSLIWNVTDPNCTTESCLLTDGKTRQAQELKRLLPDGLKGSMTINSRPWTFAICPAQGKNIDGTALGGQPLAAAGDYFYLHVRPVVWQQGGSESAPVSTTAYNLCNAAITPNFFKSDAPRLNVNISLNEKQPVSPVGGDYGQLSGNLQANNHTGNDYLNYRLTWSEVGSVPLKASGQSDYLGMTINSGYRSAGRIYPAFFGFTHNELTPAMGSFTYMGQPFPVHWVVNAFNRQGKAVGNYDKFAPKLTAKFAFDIKNSGSNSENRLLLQQPLPQTWSHNGENHHSYMSYQSDVTFARQGFQALDKVTTPDGPYNSWQLWLTITNPNAGRPAQDPRRLTPELCNPNDGCSDPDLSKMTELRLGNTNPMRYGRMVLQDAAGDIRGPVAIPLRVEYWNGAAFETNADDSGSHFDGRNYCRQILYPQPDKGNSPSTSGLGNVDQGVASNEKLVAYPDVPVLEPFKQQVRFWQRLSNSTEPKGNGISCRGTYTYQPWLSYNWRKQGDEDPSAIVTFGVYQGNKRIIYRAEAGVTSSNYQ
ncbi:TPA: DUF6701 domain-containing protein [Photobacterium damselae]